MLEKDFKNIVNKVKKQIEMTQFEIISHAVTKQVSLYYNIGKIITENSSWGNKFIDNLAIELKITFPLTRGFSIRNLKSMKKFYEEYSKNAILLNGAFQLPWSYNILIMSKVKNDEERVWYINEVLENGWNYETLLLHIDTDIYNKDVKSLKLNNFRQKLISPQSDLAIDMQKDPYIFNLPSLKEKYIEKDVEKALVDRIKDTLLALGTGFSFVGNQYKITIDDKDYFIDLLFYNIKLNCYFVIELKTREFEPSHAGQINFYLSAVDKYLKTSNQNPSVGMLMVKGKSKLSVELALQDVNKPIGVSSFEILKVIPKEVLEILPTEDDINLHIELDNKID